MAKLKVGIIGCGRISFKHLEGIINNEDIIELISLCDINKDKAIEKLNRYYLLAGKTNKISIYTNYKEMIMSEPLDIVTIATESGYHASIALDCMNQGLHVLCEKPMALSIDDADDMIECCEKNNVKLSICYQNRFNPPIQKLRNAIEENQFGRLFNGTARILWNRNDDYYKQAPWRGTLAMDGGALMNQCIHNIDLLQWMLGGEIDTVYAQTDTFLRNIEGEDYGAIIVRFKNRSVGIIEGTVCTYPKNLEETLSIFGENGTVCIGGLAVNEIEAWQFSNDLKEDNIKEEFNTNIDSVYGYGHTPLFRDFALAVINDETPYITPIDAKKSLEIILAAYKSSLTSMPVSFPLKGFSTLSMKNKIIMY